MSLLEWLIIIFSLLSLYKNLSSLLLWVLINELEPYNKVLFVFFINNKSFIYGIRNDLE